MLKMWDGIGWTVRLLFGAALMALVAGISQAQEKAAERPAVSDNARSACAEIPDSEIPLANTMQAKVTSPLDASRLKPGKKVWVNAAGAMIYPGCRLETDAAIYGTVTTASASKNPAASELSIEFDGADCAGHSKQPMKFVLIGVVAPPDQLRSLHDAVPTNTVKPGVVVGFKNLKLEPQGGPRCSARMTSPDKNIQLAQGAVLLLAVPAGQ